MATDKEKQNARDFRRSKRSGGLLTKLGTGKTGRYAKAAMLTAGMLHPSGPSGGAAFSEQDQINKSLQMQNQSATTQQYRQEQTNNFADSLTQDDSPRYSLNLGTGETSSNQAQNAQEENKTSGVTAGDEASMRRNLEQNKLQDRNAQESHQSQKENVVKSDQQDDSSLRGKWQKIKNDSKTAMNKVGKLSGMKKMSQESLQKALKAAEKAIRQVWNQGHLVTEEALWDIFYLAILFALPYALLCFGRFVFAIIGMMKIKIKGFEVNLVPQYGFNKSTAFTIGNNLAFLAIAFIEMYLISIVIWAIQHPVKAAWNAAWYTSPFGVIDIIWSWFF